MSAGRKPLAPAIGRRIRAMRRKGAAITDIASDLGLSKSAVGRIVQDMPADARAAANKARAGIKPPWLDEARRLVAAGLSRNEAAARLDVSKSTLYRALARWC